MDNISRSHSEHTLRMGQLAPTASKREKLRARVRDFSRERDEGRAHDKAREKAKLRARRFDTIGHLGPEAIVAFVDEEMEGKAAHRVRVHLVHCEECREEVRSQRGASQWVQQCSGSDDIRAPRDLLAKLAKIATTCSREEKQAGERTEQSSPRGAYGTEQDIFDKLEMIMRAIKHNQRSS